MNIKKVSVLIAFFIAIIALVNYATNKSYSPTSPTPSTSGIDIEKRNASSYKLNLEQIKADCRVSTQLLQAALMYRYQTNNMVTYEEVQQKVITTALEQLGSNNVNREAVANWAKGVWMIAIAIIAWSVHWHESANLWDYVLDPFLAIWAIVTLINVLYRKRRDKARAGYLFRPG